ncbi:hypothetical protein AAFF_G00419970 [Aldrovandia affinis]|uniref:Uncharacterized protein n=1 Tax=Aldrovandia affinis TaxID=143900 RepID=A0AAD7SA68_9TELE|nr:hypothetical protein AAFF_G00419970 [Aldrovandia affinis]
MLQVSFQIQPVRTRSEFDFESSVRDEQPTAAGSPAWAVSSLIEHREPPISAATDKPVGLRSGMRTKSQRPGT